MNSHSHANIAEQYLVIHKDKIQTFQGIILLNNTYNYIHIHKRFHKENANFARKNSHANFAEQYLQLYLYLKANS